jgi:methionyl-tRNA formyltransferase
LNIVFAGTPSFAQVALQRLHAAGFAIPLVLTQPDRPAGRGLRLQPSPVKAFALQHGIEVAQPHGLRLDGRFAADAAAAHARLVALAPDAIVVAAYGLILPPWLLALPRLGCLNIHASLLPRWRGAAPIQRAIEAGDTKSGITIMQMDAGLDTGPMLLAEATDIAPDDTTASLQERLAQLGGRLIVEALQLAGRGRLAAQAQTEVGASYAHKIAKAEAGLDWHAPAVLLERRVRAFDPFPGSSFDADGATIKCWRASVAAGTGRPGEVLRIDAQGPVVACGEAALRLEVLQRPGGRRLPAAQALGADALVPGELLHGAGD